MWVLIGYIIIIIAVFGGFMMGGGHLAALFQPFELLIIGGAASGAFVVGNGLEITKATLKTLPGLLKSSHLKKAFLLDLLSLLYSLQQKARKDGMISLERDISKPEESTVFKKYPAVLACPLATEFISDYLRVITIGAMDAFEMEQLMDQEIETYREAERVPADAITRTADALPGFGIVAAVMGVVHTMESIGLPPEELGMLIARALVGTFLGILLAYGFVAPLAWLMEHKINESVEMLQCIKTALLASLNGYAPSISIEFARKVLAPAVRPSALELETYVKEQKTMGAPVETTPAVAA